jgi:hypothetical protein
VVQKMKLRHKFKRIDLAPRAWLPSLGLPSLGALLLASCQTTDPLADLERRGPTFGASDPTQFHVETDGTTPVKIGDLVSAGETIRQYRRLGKDEQEILQALAQKSFDGFVVNALEELRPKYEPKFAAVRQEAQRAVAQVEAEKKAQIAQVERSVAPQPPAPRPAVPAPPAPPKPPAPAQVATLKAEVEQAADQKVAVIKKEEENKLAALNVELRQEAIALTQQRIGTQFAMPVKAASEQAVAVFASVRGDTVTVSDTAWELSSTPAQLTAAAGTGRPASVRHQGRENLLLASATISID